MTPHAYYRVTLTDDERDRLHDLLQRGKHTAQKRKRAHALLLADQRLPDPEIATTTGMSERGVEELRHRFVEHGFDLTLNGAPKKPRSCVLTDDDEKRLIALACEVAPGQKRHWSLRQLSQKLVALECSTVKKISYSTVRTVLKKSQIEPWQKREWCLPPKADAEYVAAMETTLALYHLPADPQFPLVCMDECPKQLIGEVREPLPPAPGQTARYDTQYKRNGTGETFVFVAPHLGWRRFAVTERRTSQDWAHQVKQLVEQDFPQAEKIRLVSDNLNTHNLASLYKTFPAPEARRLAEKLELHHTPKHASWLNMAEIEFSVLNRGYVGERVPTLAAMRAEVQRCETERNQQGVKINWSFSVDNARTKMKNTYPQL